MRGWPVIRGADVPWNEKQGQSVNSKSQMRRGLQPAYDFSHGVGLCWATQKPSTIVGHRLWRQEEAATQQVEVPREQQQKPSVIRLEKRAGHWKTFVSRRLASRGVPLNRHVAHQTKRIEGILLVFTA